MFTLKAWSAKGGNKQPEPTFAFCSIYDSPKQLLLAILQGRNFISVKISWTNTLWCRLGQECVWVCGLLAGYSRSSEQRRMNQDEWAREKSRRCIKEVFTAAWKQYAGIQLRNKEMDSWPCWRHWSFLESVNNFGSLSKTDGPYFQRKWPQTVQVPTPLKFHVQLHWLSEAFWGLRILTLELLSSFLCSHPAPIVLPETDL